MHLRYIILSIWLVLGAPLEVSAIGPKAASVIPGQLTVIGKATLQRPADEASIRFGVVSEANNASQALQANAQNMQGLITALEAVGLTNKEYQTGHFSLYPLYTERPPQAKDDWVPEVRGYKVDNQLLLRTQQIDKLGGWIDQAVQHGANTIEDIHFNLHDMRTYRSESIREAVANARSDAGELATSLGVKLGRILSVNLDQAPTPYTVQPMMMRMATSASTPISSGDVDIQASATVVFEIIQ